MKPETVLSGTVFRIISDGSRLDVQLSAETGLCRSRAASLMEEGQCLCGGRVCRKAAYAAVSIGIVSFASSFSISLFTLS